MSNDVDNKDPAPIASLSARRNQVEQENLKQAHARGEAIACLEYTYDDKNIGVTPTGLVFVMIDPQRLVGIQMTAESANLLAQALAGAAVVAHPEEKCGSPSCPIHVRMPPAG